MCGDGGGGGGGGGGYSSANDPNAGMHGSGANANSGHSGAATSPGYSGGGSGGGFFSGLGAHNGGATANTGGYDPQGDRGDGNVLPVKPQDKVNEQSKKETGTATAPAAPAPDPVEQGSATKETAPPNRPAQATPAQGSRFYRSLINYARFGSIGGTTGRTLFK